MAGLQSFAIPRCSVHLIQTVRGVDGAFVCPECFNDWLQKSAQKTEGGIELPEGVRDERLPTFQQILPNRRARRAAMRA
jgi:hypothetical protein